MSNPDLGKHLREFRKSNNYSVKYVVERLEKDYNIKYSTKTIYSWETGQNQPSADTLLILCKLYNIPNILDSFGYGSLESDTPLLLSKEEKEIILKLRSHRYFNDAVKKLMEI